MYSSWPTNSSWHRRGGGSSEEPPPRGGVAGGGGGASAAAGHATVGIPRASAVRCQKNQSSHRLERSDLKRTPAGGSRAKLPQTTIAEPGASATASMKSGAPPCAP